MSDKAMSKGITKDERKIDKITANIEVQSESKKKLKNSIFGYIESDDKSNEASIAASPFELNIRRKQSVNLNEVKIYSSEDDTEMNKSNNNSDTLIEEWSTENNMSETDRKEKEEGIRPLVKERSHSLKWWMEQSSDLLIQKIFSSKHKDLTNGRPPRYPIRKEENTDVVKIMQKPIVLPNQSKDNSFKFQSIPNSSNDEIMYENIEDDKKEHLNVNEHINKRSVNNGKQKNRQKKWRIFKLFCLHSKTKEDNSYGSESDE